MSSHLFEKIYLFLDKRRKLTIFVFFSVFLLSALGLFFVPFDNNVAHMLPNDINFSRSLKFLNESNFSDKVILSLHHKGENKTTEDLIHAADWLKENLGSPLIDQIETGMVEGEVLDDINEFLIYVPQIVSEEDLTAIEKEITPNNVSNKLKQGYKNMLSMNSMFFKYFIQNDPLSVKTEYLTKMKDLADVMEYRVKFQNGHFLSLDERHIMLILNTSVRITDSVGAKKLIDYLKKQIAVLPDYIAVDIIGGHLHTLSNENILKKDIAKTVCVVTFMLLMLLVIVFRSVRTLLVFFIPAVAIVISINITAWITGALSSFVLGLAAVIVGITVDYGIHIYLAMQVGGVRKVNEIARPVFVGVFTTMGVFASFFFSSIYGYRQFAWLTNLSIVISVFFYLFILPKLFYEQKEKDARVKKDIAVEYRVGWARVILFVWVLVLGVFIFLSQSPTFSHDIRVYDGSSSDIFETEARFYAQWGADNEFAMIVAQADSLGKVLTLNESINGAMVHSFGAEKYASIATVYPSRETRIENFLRWNLFWQNGQRKKLEGLLKEEGAHYGYSPDAFKPFFDNLHIDPMISNDESGDPKLLEHVKKRFLHKTENGYYAISYFPDKEILVNKARKISEKIESTFIISRNNMAQSISESVFEEVKRFSWIAGALIVTLTILLLRNIRLTLLALLPVVTSVFAIIGTFSVLGYALNAPSMIAILVVVGLCIDYGVFMVYDCKYHLAAGTLLAVTLSAITTIVGGGALLFATHPVLFYVGLTMVIGISSGYCAAIFVIPACFRAGLVVRCVQ